MHSHNINVLLQKMAKSSGVVIKPASRGMSVMHSTSVSDVLSLARWLSSALPVLSPGSAFR